MGHSVISVESVSKKYSRSVRSNLVNGVRELYTFGRSRQSGLYNGEFWALEDVSFSVDAGEAFGIVGGNGSGKTTLLRIIYGVIKANRGHVTRKGRIAALLAANAGFHPHLTGRENLKLMCAILGLNSEEIKKVFSEIVDFAEVGSFIDSPVSTYSSGMAVRLAFAISVFSNPEILIADEALAVGDLAFSLKCFRKIAEFQKNGGTLLFVSHSMQVLKNTCNRAAWLRNGKLEMIGRSSEVCDRFEKFMLSSYGDTLGSGDESIIRYDTEAVINNVSITTGGVKVTQINRDDELSLIIAYSFHRTVKNPIFTVSVLTVENVVVIAAYSNKNGFKAESLGGHGEVCVKLGKLPLRSGKYFITLTLAENVLSNVLEWHDKTYGFEVLADSTVSETDSLIQVQSMWDLQ